MVTYIGKQVRINKGFTIKGLAAASNVAPSSISKWENGSFIPDLTTLERVAVALKVEPFKLVTFSMEEEFYSEKQKKTKKQIAAARIGERRKMNDGNFATIIAYKNSRDIDVQFDDGTIVFCKQYGNFLKGGIVKEQKETLRDKRLGKMSTMKNGQIATIVVYRNNKDIDVGFEDGTLVRHKQYHNFVSGDIANPNYCKK